MDLTFGAPTLPSGRRVATLVSVDEVPGRFNDTALRFTFESFSGDHVGHQVRKTVGLNIAQDTTAGQWIASLVGKPLGRGDKILMEDLIGKDYELLISASQIVKASPVPVK
jgi:hypothetical protein